LDRIHPSLSALPGTQSTGFSFAGFLLEPDGTLFRGETPLHLPPKELAALRLLLAHAGQVVTHLQLRQALWGEVHVTAGSVPKCLSSLRARLEPEDCIKAVYKRGYRFTVEVRPYHISPAETLPRLAIPPFATGYGAPEHLGPAIAEGAIARLSNAPHPVISVLARDSVFTLALRGLTALEIGQTLHADFVLSGTLRTLPSHFRLRAEMIRVEDGAQIWAEDMLTDQSRLATLESDLVNRLAFRLNTGAPGDRSSSLGWNTGAPGDRSSSLGWNTGAPGDRSSSLGRNTGAPGDRFSSPGWNIEGLSISAAAVPESKSDPRRREAYELFLKGRHEWQTLERHRMQDGLQHLLRATELDPSLIAARVNLVNLCVTQTLHGFMSPAVAANIVRRTAEPWFPATGPGRGAAEPVPDFPHQAEAILPALGWINFHVDHNLPAALWAISRSAHLPHDPWTTCARSTFALSRHRFAEAITLLRAAIQLDPFSSWLHAHLAWALHLAGQATESVEQVHHAIALFPSHQGTSLYGAMILSFNGDPERGVQLAQDLALRVPHFDLASAAHAYALACAGRSGEARAILERLQWLSRERFVLNAFTPAVHVALGDLDAALSELRASADSRSPWFFQMLADPRLKPLHGRPEFQELQAILTRMETAAAENPDPEI